MTAEPLPPQAARPDVSKLPEPRREGFLEFAQAAAGLLGADLLGLVALGGWVAGDRVYADAPARSVLVLRRIALDALDSLARRGSFFRRRHVAAPLVMTPEYIRASCDSFPLELLEIQHLHVCVLGADPFTEVGFEPRDLRLQCERELKSELLQLRHGLLSAAGRRPPLDGLCATSAERCTRVLRGLLHLAGRPAPSLAMDLLGAGAAATGLKLVTLARALVHADRLAFEDFKRCYAEVEALAAYVERLPVQR